MGFYPTYYGTALYPVKALRPTLEGNKSLNFKTNSSTNDTYGTVIITCFYNINNYLSINIDIAKVFPLEVPAVINMFLSN